MGKKRTVAQRQRMSAAQKKRHRTAKDTAGQVPDDYVHDPGDAPELCCPAEAIICARKLLSATNGNVKVATKIVETIRSIT
tara:strand:- start:73 stop:315 length:243 start_codon:yes stop_codon:yes gene_type:complete